MPDIARDLQLACSDLLSAPESEQFQPVEPVPIPSRACVRAKDAARDAKGRFAKGHSGNPKGRPRGIRNPRRRPLGLLLRQARPDTLASLIERKRFLRLPVLRLVLPPPARQPDPGERLGIDFSRMRSAAEIAAAMRKALAAIGRGEIAPGEGLRLLRRARKPLRAMRRRLWRNLARREASFAGSRRTGSSSARGGGGARSAPEGAGPAAHQRPRRMLPIPVCFALECPLHHASHGPPPPLAGEEPNRALSPVLSCSTWTPRPAACLALRAA